MKISYRWLQDFVAIKAAPAELADKLTMAGLEVKSIEEKANDSVFEIEITSNRPDWLSHAGVAREVAALTSAAWKAPALPAAYAGKKLHPAEKKTVPIAVEDKQDCPLYTARVIRGVRVGPSPQWLRERLEAVGCRSVNNVVDITNYMLFAYGQPLHAFDLDTLEGGKVGVRRARPGEQLVMIDGAAKELSPDVLVICDAAKPVAIAGVMGGKATEVSSVTTNILLESAVFHPVVVRRGRQKLALQTEASYRFERGVDPQAADVVSRRAVAMILEVCGGAFISQGIKGTVTAKPVSVVVDLKRVSTMLNVSLAAARAKKILGALGFSVKAKNSAHLLVGVPSFRRDVAVDVDVLEEIARIWGYERIPSSLPRVILQHGSEDVYSRIVRVKQILAGLGLYEVVTYSLVDRALLQAFSVPLDGLVSMQDPLTQDQEVLRPSLVPSLCRVAGHNLKQQQQSVRIFEVAKVYAHAAGGPVESYRLAICVCGSRDLWYGRKYSHAGDEAGLLHLKGIVEELCRCLGAGPLLFDPGHPDGVAVMLDGRSAGMMRQVPQSALEHVDIKSRDVFVLELDVQQLFAAAGARRLFREFSRLPRVFRDISVVLERSVAAAKVVAAVKEAGAPLLVDAAVSDYYTGQPIPAGKKNLTISCTYASSQRTLQEEEVSAAHARVIARLQEAFRAEFR